MALGKEFLVRWKKLAQGTRKKVVTKKRVQFFPNRFREPRKVSTQQRSSKVHTSFAVQLELFGSKWCSLRGAVFTTFIIIWKYVWRATIKMILVWVSFI
jgi:hypothetical protein